MQIKKSPRDSQFSEETRYESPTFGMEANGSLSETNQYDSFNTRPVKRPTQASEVAGGPGAGELQASSESVVDRHSSFDGRFETDHDLRVEGTVSGEVICRGTFTVDREATARARVQARDAHIHGHLEGDIVCSGKLVLTATARVTGTVKASLLVVEEGATISGTVDTTANAGAGSTRSSTTAPKAVASSDEPREPATVTRSRRDLPSFAIVASDDRAAGDRN